MINPQQVPDILSGMCDATPEELMEAFVHAACTASVMGDVNSYWLLNDMSERFSVVAKAKDIVSLFYSDVLNVREEKTSRPKLFLDVMMINFVDKYESIRGTDIPIYGNLEYYGQ